MDFNDHITDRPGNTTCPQTLLNPALINLYAQPVQITGPSFPNPTARQNIIVQQPSQKMYISTFWHDWVRGVVGYMKRVLIPYPTTVSTMFVSAQTVGITSVRYSITLLPHLYQSSMRCKDATNPSRKRFVPYTYKCTKQFITPNRSGITCII